MPKKKLLTCMMCCRVLLVSLALFSILSCSRHPAVVALVSDLHTPTMCGVVPMHAQYEIEHFAFYLSELSVQIDDQWHPVSFLPNERQTVNTALIDLTPNCTDPSVQTIATLQLAMGYHLYADADALRFTIGVPFAANHKNPISQPPPMNEPSMFWSWQRGYKFLRWDLFHQDSGRGWAFHLGSVGCASDSALRPPIAPCQSPNRVQLEVRKGSDDGVLLVQAQKLLASIDLDLSDGCMFHLPQEPDCATLLANTHSEWITWVDN